MDALRAKLGYAAPLMLNRPLFAFTFCCIMCLLFFFFQAEDGIRDDLVTGVQTCALPIYPSSMMGSVALLRQTYLDAQWYKGKPTKEGVNMSLQAWNDEQSLPQIFDAKDRKSVV